MPSDNQTRFHIHQGLLYRKFHPESKDGAPDLYDRSQLVLPATRRPTVLHLPHTVPMAGHMGRDKTLQRLLLRFWWPGITKDVTEFCTSCAACQRTAHITRDDRAPLIPLPVIGEPFEFIAMDIVGPLQRTRSGKKYILTIVDYATRYPEAIPLSSIDAETIADALITFFSRVGLPDTILTDQGTNFTSDVVRQVAAMLRIRLITSTPYHQQTDGLVERFNGTLKSMIRRCAHDAPRSWDALLPVLLFAYREVPQSSTGFSPFELLYGRHIRGPLDLVKEVWSQPSDETLMTTAQYVIEMRQRLDLVAAAAVDNLRAAQTHQKNYYDIHSRDRSLSPGDEVLLLLPSLPRKLEAAWQGPYTVSKKVDKVNYEIDMGPYRRKRYRTYHINLLRAFRRPQLVAFTASGLPAEEDEGDTDTLLEDSSSLQGDPGQPRINARLTVSQQTDLAMLLDEFNTTLSATPGRTATTEHVIETDARPVRRRPYRLAQAHHATVKEAIEEMLDMGVIRSSCSPWASPVVLVPKKDGSTRFCVDYRALNQVSVFDAYPMPRIDDILDTVGAACFISTLDLSRGYWQIPLSKASCDKTAFTTPFGLFEFVTMPFGLHGAPATFQRCMDSILGGLPGVLAYLDDIVVFSTSWEDHLAHLAQVLTRLRDAGLTVKPKKCCLAMVQTTFLGHLIGERQVRPDPAKIEVVASWPEPKCKKQMRSFLGLAGYYRRFIPQFATVAAPLTALTTKAQPSTIHLGGSSREAFLSLKAKLTSAPVLHSPDFSREFILYTDASDVGLGALLSQMDVEGHDHPVAFASRQLLDRERRYATIEKECLALKWAILKFAPYLLGRRFRLITDHRPLQWIAQHSSGNARAARWAIALQPFAFSVQYHAGSSNGNADALSRQ